ncbi:hypothetical protein D3C81_1336440 [compost metagenome]
MNFIYRFEPDGLPYPCRTGVENTCRFLFPILLPAWNREVLTVIHSFHNNRVLSFEKSIRNICMKWGMASLMDSHQVPVNPYFGFIINRAKMQNQSLAPIFHGDCQLPLVPDPIMERGIAYTT